MGSVAVAGVAAHARWLADVERTQTKLQVAVTKALEPNFAAVTKALESNFAAVTKALQPSPAMRSLMAEVERSHASFKPMIAELGRIPDLSQRLGQFQRLAELAEIATASAATWQELADLADAELQDRQAQAQPTAADMLRRVQTRRAATWPRTKETRDSNAKAAAGRRDEISRRHRLIAGRCRSQAQRRIATHVCSGSPHTAGVAQRACP